MNQGEFITAVGRVRRSWQSGLLVCAFLQLLGYTVVTLTAFAVLDFFLALDLSACLIMDILLALVLGVWLVRRGVAIARLSEADTARYADGLLKSVRHPVLGAFELDRWLGGQRANLPEFQVYLVDKSIAAAADELKTLKFRDYFPFGGILKQAKTLVLQASIAGILLVLNGGPARVILTRIFFPLRDTPPYTEYSFKVLPAAPKVIYGGNTEIAVEIGGAPVKAQVFFHTRYRGGRHKTVCFQESDRRFAQRLEKVVSPVEFCFSTGKGRSRWQEVELLLQPEIAAATVSVTPPAYTGLAKREFQAGREEIAGYRKSRVGLFVTSNRPLSGGLLTIDPKDGLSSQKQVVGVLLGQNTVGFNWSLDDPAGLEVVITDIRGTKNRDPFKMEQKLIPDKPPEVAISEPAAFSFATPQVTIPLVGTASDDLALRKVALVRTVVGYLDRSVVVGPDVEQTRFDVERKVDLKTLGVQPGQVLEFYLEASDSNPDLTGISVSDVVRVQIISEAEYTAMLRAKTTLDEFLKRYQVAMESTARLTKKLEALRDAAKAGKSAGEVGALLEEARKEASMVSTQLAVMSRDVPIYDVEKSFNEKLAELADKIKQGNQRLAQETSPYGQAAEAAQQMLDSINGPAQEMAGQTARAKEIAEVGRVMELAATYKELVRKQAELVRRLERFNVGEQGRDLKTLAALGVKQKAVREELLQFVDELRKRADALPASFDELLKSARAFADKVVTLKIPDLMQEAMKGTDNQDAKETFRAATLALEKMRELMSGSCNSPFGGMCEQKLRFSVKESLESTMKQLLEAMCSKKGGNKGPGGAAGGGTSGGDANDGYWSGGLSPLNVPVMGPPRGSYQPSMGGGAGGTGNGRRGGAGGAAVDHSMETTDNVGTGTTGKQGKSIEVVPEKYRDAIKKYFSTGEEKNE